MLQYNVNVVVHGGCVHALQVTVQLCSSSSLAILRFASEQCTAAARPHPVHMHFSVQCLPVCLPTRSLVVGPRTSHRTRGQEPRHSYLLARQKRGVYTAASNNPVHGREAPTATSPAELNEVGAACSRVFTGTFDYCAHSADQQQSLGCNAFGQQAGCSADHNRAVSDHANLS